MGRQQNRFDAPSFTRYADYACSERQASNTDSTHSPVSSTVAVARMSLLDDPNINSNWPASATHASRASSKYARSACPARTVPFRIHRPPATDEQIP